MSTFYVPWGECLFLAVDSLTSTYDDHGVVRFIGAPVTSVAGRTGAVVLTIADVSGAAPLASPTLTGTPAAPTATVNTNTTQLATTAFVLAQAGAATPLIDGTAAVGTATKFAREDHIHPTDTTRAPLASPTLTGTPAAPTALQSTATTQIATTAFVRAGTATNDSAAAGQVGEVISSNIVAASAVAMVTGTAKTVTSISLTAGDWDVSAELWAAFGTGGGTSVQAGINTTTNAMPSDSALGTARVILPLTVGVSATIAIPVTTCRVSIASTTSYFLVGNAAFPSGSTSCYGKIIGRRPR